MWFVILQVESFVVCGKQLPPLIDRTIVFYLKEVVAAVGLVSRM
jgi:hypothetical protein